MKRYLERGTPVKEGHFEARPRHGLSSNFPRHQVPIFKEIMQQVGIRKRKGREKAERGRGRGKREEGKRGRGKGSQKLTSSARFLQLLRGSQRSSTSDKRNEVLGS
jgi:hypothetical protein